MGKHSAWVGLVSDLFGVHSVDLELTIFIVPLSCLEKRAPLSRLSLYFKASYSLGGSSRYIGKSIAFDFMCGQNHWVKFCKVHWIFHKTFLTLEKMLSVMKEKHWKQQKDTLPAYLHLLNQYTKSWKALPLLFVKKLVKTICIAFCHILRSKHFPFVFCYF